MDCLALFFTHSGAIKYKRILSKEDIPCELMPVPRRLSSNCGICAKFTIDNFEAYINEDIEKIYELSNGVCNLVYDNE